MNEHPTNRQIKETNSLKYFIKSNKAIVVLILIIIALLIYFTIRINVMENEFVEKTETIKKEHLILIDSVNIAGLQQTIKVFSWAVRSEMNRNNLEEVNNFFLTFVKEKGIRMINLINSENSRIILSTDKKNEGQEITDPQIINVSDLKMYEKDGKKYLITPITRLNKSIGIMMVEIILPDHITLNN